MGEKEFGELKTVDYVDLERFMGDWYVIANIPTFIEKGAVNAVESYELDSKGRINTSSVNEREYGCVWYPLIRKHPMESIVCIDLMTRKTNSL